MGRKNNKRKGKGRRFNDGNFQLNRDYPKNVTGLFIRAQLKFNQGDIQGAALDLDEYLSAFPNNVKVLIFRGVVLYYLLEYHSAINDLSDAILIEPDVLSAYLIRGDIYRTIGKFIESIDDFDKVIETAPEEAIAYIGRGDTRLLLHDTAGAKRDYAMAIAINPSLITLCPEIGTLNDQEAVSVLMSDQVSMCDQKVVSTDDQMLGLSKMDVDIHYSFFEVSKIRLSWRLRKLKYYYHKFKVMIDSSLNFVILCFVFPIYELLSNVVIAALIET